MRAKPSSTLPAILADIFKRRRILVCVGSGGVGKTTSAAALALCSALRGRKTLVLTIDPARRLANSLGLRRLGHEVQRVPDNRLELAAKAGGIDRQPGGQLHAMMLDQKKAFDELVERYASEPAAVSRILANPVYSQISSSLAGAQEYAAMAKLHEFDQDSDFETIIVDTPPTAHALDFLDAPERLTRAIDSPAIEWFRKLRDSRGGWSVVGATGAYVLGRLSKFVGAKFIDDLAVFFTDFNDILGGFRARAETTFAALRQSHVGFLLVASPEPMALREALSFHARLLSSNMNFDGFIINRVHQNLPQSAELMELQNLMKASPAVADLGYQDSTIRIAAEALRDSHAELQVLAAADRESIDDLRSTSDAIVEVPFLSQDVHDMERLIDLGLRLLRA